MKKIIFLLFFGILISSCTKKMPYAKALDQLRSATPADSRPRLFIISSFYRDVAYDSRVAKAYPSLSSYVQFYEELAQQGDRVAVFSPAREGKEPPFHEENIYAPTVYLSCLERPGPRVEIWTLKVKP